MLRSRVVLAGAFVTLLVGYVHSTPSCHLRERPLDHLYVCTGFTSPSDFEELIQRPLFYPNTTFVLRNSTLDHLPEGAFARLSVRDLELRNVQVTSFAGHDTAPFSGLETSLKKISFTEDSSLPESWGVLKNLRNLTALGLARMTHLNLTRDFENLPSNVRTIAVVSSTIESVDPNWLSNMDKLGAVVLRSSNFGQVNRAMFPTTAPNMWRIDLFATGLTSIPTGFNEGMPSLKYLDLGDNNITTIDEASATALFDIGLTKLTLFDNPLHCDCSLSFIVNHPDPPGDEVQLARANNEFALNLLKELSSRKPGGNVIFSPTGIYEALAMVYAGSRGESQAELSKVLGHDGAGLKNRDAVLSAYKKLYAFKNDSEMNVTLNVVNAVLVQEELRVLDGYKTELAEVFGAKLKTVDFFNESSRVSSEISQWVRQKTGGKIKSVLPDGIPMNTVMLLLNAVYFKGTWLIKFDPEQTVQRPFYNHGTKFVAKDTMVLRGEIKHAWLLELDAQAVELPYKDERFAMVIVLPNSKTGLPKLRDSFSLKLMDEIDEELDVEKVHLKLPKFELKAGYDLVPSLQRLGLKSVFTSDADLSGISGSRDLAVSDVKHAAVVEVNEEGTAAASATSAGIVAKSIPQTANFYVDHPFLFYVHDVESKRVLFMGEVHEL
ncbi:hypothetical protein ISCGN_027266 [Ixodes scapularis]